MFYCGRHDCLMCTSPLGMWYNFTQLYWNHFNLLGTDAFGVNGASEVEGNSVLQDHGKTRQIATMPTSCNNPRTCMLQGHVQYTKSCQTSLPTCNRQRAACLHYSCTVCAANLLHFRILKFRKFDTTQNLKLLFTEPSMREPLYITKLTVRSCSFRFATRATTSQTFGFRTCSG